MSFWRCSFWCQRWAGFVLDPRLLLSLSVKDSDVYGIGQSSHKLMWSHAHMWTKFDNSEDSLRGCISFLGGLDLNLKFVSDAVDKRCQRRLRSRTRKDSHPAAGIGPETNKACNAGKHRFSVRTRSTNWKSSSLSRNLNPTTTTSTARFALSTSDI